jgi:hypothetical protein
VLTDSFVAITSEAGRKFINQNRNLPRVEHGIAVRVDEPKAHRVGQCCGAKVTAQVPPWVGNGC